MRVSTWFAAIVVVMAALGSVAQAGFLVLLNELEPNPPGADSGTTVVELLGAPGTSYSGVLVAIESDGANGTVNNTGLAFEPISGTFDANGILTGSVTDFENPSFTLILADDFTGDLSTDIDTNDDGSADNLVNFVNIRDAVNIPDSSSDAALTYASDAGGTDFAYTGDEPKLIFRDGVTLDWYAVNDQGNTPEAIFDANGNQIAATATWRINGAAVDPEVSTFGGVNPTIPEPTTLALLAMGGLGLALRRRQIA